MVTRAESLLIIVGDHRLLSKDHDWNVFINFIAEKDAMRREGRKLHPRVEFNK